MNASTFRGFALLALVCVPPCLRAFTININGSDTHLFSGSAGSGGDGASIGWTIPFSVPDRPSYLTCTIAFHSKASASNPNPFNFEINNNVFLAWTPRVVVGAIAGGQSFGAAGVPQNLAKSATQGPLQSLSVAGTFDATLTLSGIIDPSGLGGDYRFFLLPSAQLVAGTQYGGGTHTASISGTLTIESIPETGFTLPWAFGAIVTLGLLHRRMNRTWPTL